MGYLFCINQKPVQSCQMTAKDEILWECYDTPFYGKGKSTQKECVRRNSMEDAIWGNITSSSVMKGTFSRKLS